MKPPPFPWPLLVILAACGGPRSEIDIARVCLSPQMTGGSTGDFDIASDQPLTLYATSTAGCHTDQLDVFCSAVVDGDRILVTTETTWIRTEPLAMSCESIAYYAVSECLTDQPLAEGTYTVEYAGQELVIDVPSTPGEDDCIDP